LPGVLDEAEALLNAQPATRSRLERVGRLIDGFESPFGMELLGTVHWVMTHSSKKNDASDVIVGVQSWNERKRSQLKPGHIEAARKGLSAEGWVGTTSA